jgi:putative FmdB family regulatory protein
MPIYEFECPEHGVFEELRSISECSTPALCQGCGALAARILSRPNLAALPRSEVIARDRNEKSRFEPTVSNGPSLPTEGRSRSVHKHKHEPAKKPGEACVYSGPRPWVIEHG